MKKLHVLIVGFGILITSAVTEIVAQSNGWSLAPWEWCEYNPILGPRGTSWQARKVFDPSAIMKDGLAVDKWLLLAIAGLLAVGMTMVLSTSYLHSQERYGDGTYFFRKQLIAMSAGLVGLVACSLIPSSLYRRFAYPLLALSFVGVVLVRVPGFGARRGGARPWVRFRG